MKIKFKKLHNEARVPTRAHSSDAGADLYAISKNGYEDKVVYGTGLAVAIPEGHVGLLFPRSSINKYHLDLCNSVGVLDSGYRGEIKFVFRRLTTSTGSLYGVDTNLKLYEVGDKIGQLVVIPYPKIEFEEVEELSETERGSGGFGSSGA